MSKFCKTNLRKQAFSTFLAISAIFSSVFFCEIVILSYNTYEYPGRPSLAQPDRGTIYHVRNIFNFRQVKKDIGNCFSDGWELMSVMTESFVCHLAMTMLQMTETTDRPGNAPEHIEDASDEDKRKYLADTTRKLTEFLAFKLDTNALRLQDNPHGTGTNCCEEDTDEDLVCCAAGIRCARGQWFHYSCAGLDIEHLPEEFYCSDECRSLETGHSYQYCTCKCDLGDLEPMVGCAAGSRCVRCEWYHTKCLEINIEDLPKGDWFCSEECRVLKKKTSLKSSPERKDYKNEYSRAMTWCGLNLLCRRDAVREGDGEAMIRYWRLDLAHFFATRHPKYVILAHRLICATHGWLPEKLQEEIIWNRTVNYSGGKGRNLPMDLMNEILNRLFKDMLEGSKGRYTEETIQRCGQLVGPLGEALDKVFDENVIERELYSHRRRSQNRDRNVKTLVALLQQEQLFAVIPGRQHKAFPEFSHNINPKQPEKFLPKMKQLSTRLDKCRDIILDE